MHHRSYFIMAVLSLGFTPFAYVTDTAAPNDGLDSLSTLLGDSSSTSSATASDTASNNADAGNTTTETELLEPNSIEAMLNSDPSESSSATDPSDLSSLLDPDAAGTTDDADLLGLPSLDADIDTDALDELGSGSHHVNITDPLATKDTTTYPTTANTVLNLPGGIGNFTFLAPGATPQGKSAYTIQALHLADLVGTVTQDGQLNLAGTFTINGGSSGTVSWVSFDKSSATLTLKLTFDTPAQATVLPGKTITITTCALVIDSSSSTLSTVQALFQSTPDSSITFDLATINNSGGLATIKQSVPLTTVVPQAQSNKDLATVQLSNITIDFPNPFIIDPSTIGQPPTMTLNAMANLSQIVLYGRTHLSDSQATITFNGQSINLACNGQTPISFDSNFTLDQPTIDVSMMVGIPCPDLSISGILEFTLPVVGTGKVPVHGEKGMGFFTLTGSLNNALSFSGIHFHDPKIILTAQSGMGGMMSTSGSDKSGKGGKGGNKSSNDGSMLNVEINGGSFDFAGMSAQPVLKFISTGTGDGRIVAFSGNVNAGKPFHPLKKIPGLSEIPGIADFILNQAKLGCTTSKQLFFSGTTELLKIATTAKINLTGTKSIIASTAKPWKLSDSFSWAKNTPVDIPFQTINFGYTAGDYYDAELGMYLQKGFNAFGTINMRQGIFAPLHKLFGPLLPASLTAGIIIPADPLQSRVEVAIPLDIQLCSRASIHNLVFFFTPIGSFGIQISLLFIPDRSRPPLILTGSIEFGPAYFTPSVSLQGMWVHPFGIPGLSVGNLAVEATISPASPEPLIGLGATGTIAIGSMAAMMAFKFGPPDQVLMIAEVSEWPLFMLPDVLRMVGLNLGPLDILKAIDISLYNVMFKFAPTGGQIGVIYFDPGITAAGQLVVKIPHIINLQLAAGFELAWTSGFKMYAMMPEFKLGPLKVTGKGTGPQGVKVALINSDRSTGISLNAGPKMEQGAGPIFNAELNLSAQRIFISALVELFNSTADVEIQVGLTSLKFHMLLKLLGFLNFVTDGETYHNGWRIGFKMIATATLGKSTVIQLFGDVNTYGCTFAGKAEGLSLSALLSNIPGVPENNIPCIRLKDLEIYVRAQA